MKIENKTTTPNLNDETGLIIETFANDDTIEKSKEDSTASTKKKSEAIVIFDRVQTKLKISNKGKIYRQRIGNYIPIIGPLFSSIYANFVIGKTRCLRKIDALNFRKLSIWTNLFAFLVWPIVFFGFWTLMSYLIANMSSVGATNYYENVLWGNYIAQINALRFDQISELSSNLGILFSGFFQIAIFPLTSSIELNGVVNNLAFNFAGTLINTNIIFIASVIILLLINPIHIFNTIMFNCNKYKFKVIDLEEYLKLY